MHAKHKLLVANVLPGLSLTELLIGLALLGIIGSLMVPRLLNTFSEQQHKAKFQEFYSLSSQILSKGYLDGSIRSQNQFAAALLDTLNVERICRNDALAEGCWTAEMYNTTDRNEGGFITHSGIYVTGIAGYGYPEGTWFANAEGFWVDINGPNGPNELNQDVIILVACFQEVADCYDWTAGWPGKKGPGTLVPSWQTDSFKRLMDLD